MSVVIIVRVQVYCLKSKGSKKDIQKSSVRSNGGALVCAEGDKEKRNKGIGACGDAHPATPATCEESRPGESSASKEQQQRKAYANITQGQSQFPSQAGRAQQLWPHGSGVRFQKDGGVKGSWGFLLQSREAMCVAGKSLHAAPERPWCEALRGKPGLP